MSGVMRSLPLAPKALTTLHCFDPSYVGMRLEVLPLVKKHLAVANCVSSSVSGRPPLGRGAGPACCGDDGSLRAAGCNNYDVIPTEPRQR